MTPYQTPPPPLVQRRSLATSTFYLTLLLSLIILTIPTPASAQTPAARRRPAFTQYNNQFFVHGGIVGPDRATGDLSALSLNSSWSTANPAWTTLASGSWVWHHAMVPVRPEHSAGLGSTSSKGFLLSAGGYPTPLNAFFSVYNLQTGTWANLTTTSPYTGLEGHTAVSDPSTGRVYIMGGFYNNNPLPNSKIGNLLTVFDPNTATVVSKVVATDANNMTGASALWSSRRKTVLLFEGSRAVNTGDVKGIAMTAVQEYDTTAAQWKTFATTGAFPPPRLDACAVESEDGSKIIYFGGTTDIDTVLTSIFILDVDSGKWTEGLPAPGKRQQMACAYYGGFFVVFGGTSSRNWDLDLYSNQVIAYDVAKNQWVSQYTPSAVVLAPSDNPNGSTSGGSGGSGDGSGGGGAGNTGPDDQSGDKSNLGAIIGAVAGAIVVLLIILAMYLIRRRRRLAREKDVKDTEARAAAMLAAEEKHKKEYEPKIMTAADHYAAAQAALEEASKRLRPSVFKGAKSWISEENSNSVSDSSNSTDFSKARRLSDPEVQANPVLYYQQLLLKQRQLQMLHPHLVGGVSHRSPHSYAAVGDHGSCDDSDCSSTSSSRRNSTESSGAGGEKRGLMIKTDQVWVPPQGIQELIVSPPPSSPQDWSGGSNLVNTPVQQPLAVGMTQRIDLWDLDLTPSTRSPHAVVVDELDDERVSRPVVPPSISVTSVDSSSHTPPSSFTSILPLISPS